MTVYRERTIEELERQLVEATTQEEVDFIERKLKALRENAE